MSVNLLLQCLSNTESYPNSKDLRIKVLRGDKKGTLQTEIISDGAGLVYHLLSAGFLDGDSNQQTFSSESLNFIFISKLAKDCVETFNDDFITQCQQTILPRLEEIALYNREFRDGNRGRTFFSENPNQEQAITGVSMLRLVLECIWVWAKWFPVDPDTQKISLYKLTLEKLVKMGVIFPKLMYFDFSDVSRQLPEFQVPVKLLREAKQIIQEDLIVNRGAGSPSNKLVTQLNLNLMDAAKLTQGTQDLFPVDRFKRVLKNKSVTEQQMKDKKMNNHIDQAKVLQYKAYSQQDLKAEVRNLIVKKQHLEKDLQQTDALLCYLKALLKEQPPATLNVPGGLSITQTTNQNSPLADPNRDVNKSSTMSSTQGGAGPRQKRSNDAGVTFSES